MLGGFFRHAVEQKERVLAPAKMRRFADFGLQRKVVAAGVGINRTAVRAAYASAHPLPGLRLKNVIQPQPAPLLGAEGFADAHIF